MSQQWPLQQQIKSDPQLHPLSHDQQSQRGFGCPYLHLGDSAPDYYFSCGNGTECAVPLDKELKDIFEYYFFQNSFAIYSELFTLSWGDVNEATDRAFVCAYLQLLQLEKTKISLFCLLVHEAPEGQFSVSNSSVNLAMSRFTGANKGDFQPNSRILAALLRVFEHSRFYKRKCRKT